MLITSGGSTATRQVNLISVCQGLVYIGSIDPVVSNNLALGQGGGALLNQVNNVQIAFLDNVAYLTDGLNLYTLTMTGSTLAAAVASAGTLPPTPRLCCAWRGSLVISESTNPQNWYMSRIGSYLDFDYSASATDPTRAIAGNSGASFGKIGDPIVSLMPLNDDILLFGCTNSMFAFVGDPRYNGVVDHFLHDIGIVGPNAWAFDPVGTLYWIADSGLMRLPKGGTIPDNLSQTVLPDFFQAISGTNDFIELVWDQDRHGLWVFVTTLATGASTHLFWDQRTGGFFPIQFPNGQGPTAAVHYPAANSANRRVLLGGRDGHIRTYSEQNTSDDGTAISSHVYLGPQRPIDPVTEAKSICLDLYLGNDVGGFTYNLQYQINGAADPYDAINNPARTTTPGTTSTLGHIKDRTQRTRGGDLAVLLSNAVLNKTWNMEQVVLTVVPGGPQR